MRRSRGGEIASSQILVSSLGPSRRSQAHILDIVDDWALLVKCRCLKTEIEAVRIPPTQPYIVPDIITTIV